MVQTEYIGTCRILWLWIVSSPHWELQTLSCTPNAPTASTSVRGHGVSEAANPKACHVGGKGAPGHCPSSGRCASHSVPGGPVGSCFQVVRANVEDQHGKGHVTFQAGSRACMRFVLLRGTCCASAKKTVFFTFTAFTAPILTLVKQIWLTDRGTQPPCVPGTWAHMGTRACLLKGPYSIIWPYRFCQGLGNTVWLHLCITPWPCSESFYRTCTATIEMSKWIAVAHVQPANGCNLMFPIVG